MRALKVVMSAVLMGACASSSSVKATSGTVGPATTTQTISGVGGVGGATAVTLVNDARSTKESVPLTPAQAWPRLLAAYDSLGIKLTDVNATQFTLGNPGLRARRRIGNIQLRLALNCGGDSSNPNAESYDLTLTVSSSLKPEGSGSVLETYIRGTGVNAMTNNTNYVQCYSLGVIEKRVAELVRAGVAAPVRK